jgi:hypothetical protein
MDGDKVQVIVATNALNGNWQSRCEDGNTHSATRKFENYYQEAGRWRNGEKLLFY